MAPSSFGAMLAAVALDRDLRTTFDSVADSYQAARPDYPDELFDDLIGVCGLRPSAPLLEVGCGPGKATLPLARRGFHITALELGASLAAVATRNLAEFSKISVVHTSFEDWAPTPHERFDLVYAATAWAWIDPATKYAKVASLLAPGGHLAVWGAGHAFPADVDPFFFEIQSVYIEIGEPHPGEWPPPPPENEPDESEAFHQSGLFTVVAVRRYLWAIEYTAEAYIALLNTFSGHIAMEPAKRDHLYAEIRARIAARPARTINRHWGAVMTIGELTSS